jgi:hypothetical protein
MVLNTINEVNEVFTTTLVNSPLIVVLHIDESSVHTELQIPTALMKLGGWFHLLSIS